MQNQIKLWPYPIILSSTHVAYTHCMTRCMPQWLTRRAALFTRLQMKLLLVWNPPSSSITLTLVLTQQTEIGNRHGYRLFYNFHRHCPARRTLHKKATHVDIIYAYFHLHLFYLYIQRGVTENNTRITDTDITKGCCESSDEAMP